MGDVVDLNEHQPHIVVPDFVTGKRYVLPVSLVREWAYGRAPLPSDPALLRGIVWDWLCSFENEPIEPLDVPPPPAA